MFKEMSTGLFKKSYSYKNLPTQDSDLEIESENETDQDTLNLTAQQLSSIPSHIAFNNAKWTTALILSKNRLKKLKNLKYFKNLLSLQLDSNKLKHINNLPQLPKLTTLWLNNNNLQNLDLLLPILKKNTPNLEYLSLLLNPLCPALKSNDDAHKQYRLNVICNLPKLKVLDAEPVTTNEREQSTLYCKPVQLDNCADGYSSGPNSPNSLKANKYNKDTMVRYIINGETFRVYSYYKPIKIIGSGAYGIVCSAIDQRNNQMVAIKKSKHLFNKQNNDNDAKNILREIRLLSFFTKNKNEDIISIYDCITPNFKEIESFKEVYIIMPLYDTTLLEIIDSKQTLSHSHFQYLTYQILRGLKYIHECGVIHRDIKPENILINGDKCDVKIIDFGLARGVNTSDEIDDENLTQYVCTRWYRAPEVMCNVGKYDKSIDIWSVGCILAEMILKKPLFPGDNAMHQLEQIFNTMNGSTKWIVNPQAKKWIDNNIKRNENTKKSIQEIILEELNGKDDKLNEQCVDLLFKLLELNPDDRISANDALKHPYFKNYFMKHYFKHNDHSESICDTKKFVVSNKFEKMITTNFGLRHTMVSQLRKIHQQRWKRIVKKRKMSKHKQSGKLEIAQMCKVHSCE